jgi:DNA (cytosine-5)-methyltransferase 1
MTKLKFIELFAGCGGMSLGFHSEDFELFFANELSPMAGETFAFNILNEDLRSIAAHKAIPEKVLWLSSKFSKENIINRLNEEPLKYKPEENSDLHFEVDLKNKLIIGNIIELNHFLTNHKHLIPKEIDVISGGPPCQSFSMSGLRKKDDPKNQLPFAFAEFVSLVKPKFVVLENVTGILRPFANEDGEKYHAWIEISRYFVEKGYAPICLHVNAKFVGIPQSRPRFIMIGIRQDIAHKIKNNLLNQSHRTLDFTILEDALYFFNKPTTLPYLYDAHQPNSQHYFDLSFLSCFKQKEYVYIKDAIDDLINPKANQSYKNFLSSTFKYSGQNTHLIENQEKSNCNEHTKMRFKLYQILNKYDSKEKKLIKSFLNDEEINLNNDILVKLLKEEYLLESKIIKFNEKKELMEYLNQLKTKKRSQNALSPHQISPTIQSNPDDIIHYEKLRPITVREMARLQSFPDWFIFKSKRTTGGDRRKFEVPQQTQVGNAVPPLLAKQIAKFIKGLSLLS